MGIVIWKGVGGRRRVEVADGGGCRAQSGGRRAGYAGVGRRERNGERRISIRRHSHRQLVGKVNITENRTNT